MFAFVKRCLLKGDACYQMWYCSNIYMVMVAVKGGLFSGIITVMYFSDF